ncbi:vascular cell adhesion protein 1-like [Labrus mixtus]|uniref:vascular cell adhesion protein 1-like n=1 Tax=Labrus mixtus TaxID=508554 RepID=UPI0029C0DF37|nr:vascular cell adhesion protein 1-like [Labrus mixtus]XP_060919955.1 vascular cell adhesion protein 1-like [Labrus mixtus]
MGVTAVLSVNMVTAIMLLTVFSLSEASDECRTYWSVLFITTPKKMEALSGTCLKIPCSFSVKKGKEEFDNTRETFGIWFKEDRETYNPNNVVFNSDGTVNTFQMNITGNLRMKNCTTLIYNMKTTYEGVYYFRIMNWPFRASARCDPLHITIKDSPPSPKLIISGDLKEKESVTITCSASTPCPLSPPKLTWTLKQDSLNNMEENPDKTFTTKIQEQITLTDKHDGYNITCSATYPVNEGKEVKTAEETQTLRVSYAPKNTSASISPSGLVSAGIHVNLTCSSRANPPVSSFTWFKISRDGHMIVSEGEFYSFDATEGGVYYCVAMNDLSNQTSPLIHLRVAENLISDLFGVDVHITLKILGIVLLCSSVIIFECWLKSRCFNKQVKDAEEADYVNRVVMIQAS